MEQFGDELIIQSFKIPWLIWIHLLVTVLLVILLFFGFTVFTSDDSISPSSSTAASPSTYSAAAVPAHLTKPSSSNRKSKIIDQCCKKYRLRPPRRSHRWVGNVSRRQVLPPQFSPSEEQLLGVCLPWYPQEDITGVLFA